MSAPDGGAPAGVAADHERLARVLEEEGLATVDGGPGVFGWLRDVADRALEDALFASLPALGGTAPWIAGAVLLVAAIVAVVVIVRLVGSIRAARGAYAGGAADTTAPLPTPAAPPSRADIDRHLAAGDAPRALGALWRWVAAHVEAHGLARPAPDRTNRELLAEVRRAAPGWERLPHLVRLTNDVDALLYGGESLDVDAVRALVPLADEVVR